METRKLPQDFGQYLTYKEGIRSDTALRKHIDNTPTEEQYEAMCLVYDKIYVPLIEHFHRKIPVSSFFRCLKLNTAVGGSKTSDHMYGRAIDLDADGMGIGLTNKMIYDFIKNNLEYKQLIFENPDKVTNIAAWVHCSYDPTNNKKQNLKMVWVNGKQQYQEI